MINPNVAQKARPIMATIDDHLTVGPDRRVPGPSRASSVQQTPCIGGRVVGAEIIKVP